MNVCMKQSVQSQKQDWTCIFPDLTVITSFALPFFRRVKKNDGLGKDASQCKCSCIN